MTSLTLQKDAFEDEVSHVRLEMSELRVQLDNVYDDNALLNKSKSELEVKVEMLEKETREVEEVLQAGRREAEEIRILNEAMRRDLGI